MSTMPVIDMVATGRNIVRLREAAGLTVKDLQVIFGFATPQAIYKWQHGTAMPSVDNLVVLAMALGVTMDEIIVVIGDGANVLQPVPLLQELRSISGMRLQKFRSSTYYISSVPEIFGR